MAHPTAAGGGAVRPLVPGLGGSCVRQYRRPGSLEHAGAQLAAPRQQGSRRAPCGLLEPPRGACGGLVAPAPARCARGLWGLSGLEQVSLRASRSGARGASPARALVVFRLGQRLARNDAASARLPRRGGAATRCERTAATAPGGGGRGRRWRRGQWPRMPDHPSEGLRGPRPSRSSTAPRLWSGPAARRRGGRQRADAPRLRVRRLGSSPFFPVKLASGRGASPGFVAIVTRWCPGVLIQPQRGAGPECGLLARTVLLLAPALTDTPPDRQPAFHHARCIPQLGPHSGPAARLLQRPFGPMRGPDILPRPYRDFAVLPTGLGSVGKTAARVGPGGLRVCE